MKIGKIFNLGILFLIGLLILPLTSAWGVTWPYYREDKPLYMCSGTSTTVILTIQNAYGDIGNITVSAKIINGSEIATLIDGSEYFVPYGSGNGLPAVPVRVRVEIPADAKPEDKWEVRINFASGGGYESWFLVIVNCENQPPEADADGPYLGYEGKIITFDASLSSDPDDDELEYRWDFNGGGWDTNWSDSPYAEYTWQNDFSGQVVVEVSDGATTDTTTATVKGLIDALEELIDKVENMNLLQGIETSLVVKLENAIDAAEKDNYNVVPNHLEAFMNEAEAQRGKHLTEDQVDSLIADAQWIIDNM